MSGSAPSENTAPPATTPGGKVLLFVSAALLVAWLGWLSYTALTKSREPTVSRAQAAAAGVPVVAELMDGQPDREVKLSRPGGIGGAILTPLKEQGGKPGFVVEVVEPLLPGGLAQGTKIGVINLPQGDGYTGPGKYLLLLNAQEGATLDSHPAYLVVGQQRSPGADMEGSGPPVIYRWGSDVEAQARRLFPAKD